MGVEQSDRVRGERGPQSECFGVNTLSAELGKALSGIYGIPIITNDTQRRDETNLDQTSQKLSTLGRSVGSDDSESQGAVQSMLVTQRVSVSCVCASQL